jgi:hypothetical protein
MHRNAALNYRSKSIHGPRYPLTFSPAGQVEVLASIAAIGV